MGAASWRRFVTAVDVGVHGGRRSVEGRSSSMVVRGGCEANFSWALLRSATSWLVVSGRLLPRGGTLNPRLRGALHLASQGLD